LVFEENSVGYPYFVCVRIPVIIAIKKAENYSGL